MNPYALIDLHCDTLTDCIFSHLFLLFQGIACRKFGMLSIDN